MVDGQILEKAANLGLYLEATCANGNEKNSPKKSKQPNYRISIKKPSTQNVGVKNNQSESFSSSEYDYPENKSEVSSGSRTLRLSELNEDESIEIEKHDEKNKHGVGEEHEEQKQDVIELRRKNVKAENCDFGADKNMSPNPTTNNIGITHNIDELDCLLSDLSNSRLV